MVISAGDGALFVAKYLPGSSRPTVTRITRQTGLSIMNCASSKSDSDTSQWAVIAGIDLYSSTEPQTNLRGCCNDALLVSDFLHRSLGLPEENISLHLSANTSYTTRPSRQRPPNFKPGFATEFFRSLDHVRDHANPGDFVHIHFSGHGTRGPTRHPDIKSAAAQDERLCFFDNEVTDVEFGKKLDVMSEPPHSLVLFVTLDCCFSGGASRWGNDTAVRCKPEDISRRGEPSENVRRDATPRQSWLYRDRGYNVMAACQPYEKSAEGPDRSGYVHGAFTSHLISQLNNLGDHRAVTTYGRFQGVLETALKANLSKVTTQKPMHLGPPNRMLFQSLTCNRSDKVSYVVRANQDEVEIEKGQASGARIGDVYRLSHPGKPHSESVTCITTKLKEYSSCAQFCEEGSNKIHVDLVGPGWYVFSAVVTHHF